jgi:hypothetical protein
MDIEFKQFLDNFQADVASLVYTEGDGALFEDKFTEYCLEILENSGETEGPRVCSYIYPGDAGKDWKINGYCFRDLYKGEDNKAYYETLDLFITYYQSDYSYNITKDTFNKGLNQVKRFLNASFKGHIDYIDPSHEIAELVKELAKQSLKFDRVNIFYLINGTSKQSAEKIAIKGFEELGVYVHVWDIQRFFRLSVSSTNREPIEINVGDFTPEGLHGIQCLKVPDLNELYECYMAILPGSVLSKLYAEFSSKLLESNVRAFLGQAGKFNKAIKETIRDKPQMFLPYNNGLSATADYVETKLIDSQLYITKLNDFQIVNGGQTTASLYHTEKQYKDIDLSKVFVQMKLTVIKDIAQKNTEVPLIARFANSQNKISELDLSSNNPFFVRIEELSRRKYVLNLENKNQPVLWYFERVNGQYRESLSKLKASQQKAFKEKNPASNKFVKSDISKFINLWELEPHYVSQGSQKNFLHFTKKINVQIAKNKLPGDNFYKKLIANAIIFKSVDRLFGRKNAGAIGDTNLKSFTVAYTVSYFHHLSENRLDLWKIYEDQQIDPLIEILFRDLIVFTYDHLLKSANNSLISEYVKKESSWNLLRNEKFDIYKYGISHLLVSEEETAEREKEQENVVVDNDIFIVSKITSLGLKFWDGFKIYTGRNEEYKEIELDVWDVVKKLKAQKSLDSTGVKIGKKVLELIDTGIIDLENIKSLSVLEDIEPVNIKAIYDKMAMLKKEDWSSIIALSEQTKIFDNLELSNIKSVQRAINAKEKINEVSLLKTNESLLKLKRFGIKY